MPQSCRVYWLYCIDWFDWIDGMDLLHWLLYCIDCIVYWLIALIVLYALIWLNALMVPADWWTSTCSAPFLSLMLTKQLQLARLFALPMLPWTGNHPRGSKVKLGGWSPKSTCSRSWLSIKPKSLVTQPISGTTRMRTSCALCQQFLEGRGGLCMQPVLLKLLSPGTGSCWPVLACSEFAWVSYLAVGQFPIG